MDIFEGQIATEELTREQLIYVIMLIFGKKHFIEETYLGWSRLILDSEKIILTRFAKEADPLAIGWRVDVIVNNRAHFFLVRNLADPDYSKSSYESLIERIQSQGIY